MIGAMAELLAEKTSLYRHGGGPHASRIAEAVADRSDGLNAEDSRKLIGRALRALKEARKAQ